MILDARTSFIELDRHGSRREENFTDHITVVQSVKTVLI